MANCFSVAQYAVVYAQTDFAPDHSLCSYSNAAPAHYSCIDFVFSAAGW